MTNFGTVLLHVCDSSSENHRFLLLGEAMNATIMMKLSSAASTGRIKSEFVSVHHLFMISTFKLKINSWFSRLAVINVQCSITIYFFSIISFFFSFYYCSLNDFSSRYIPVLMLELENKFKFGKIPNGKMLFFRE